MVDAILNEQAFHLPIDILWETNIGETWHDLTALREGEFDSIHAAEPNRGILPIPGENPELTYKRSRRNKFPDERII